MTWRPGREDAAPLLLIVLLPLLVAAPQLLDWLKADPVLYTGWLTEGLRPGLMRGAPYIDPNNGFQTQALGYRAAMDWLDGRVPWWNPFSGVGLPLAGEYQPSAFFPLTFLLLLPHGMSWLQVALQVLAGWGMYALLRQLGITRLAAATGGLLYAFNGTLAWFAHGPASPVPFLPWMLYGIERAYAKAAARERGGWRTLALAMAMALLAGFPETAYIGGLLALAWSILRAVQTAPDARRAYAGRIALGGLAGIAVAAPQLLAFAQFLPHADIGGHSEVFAHLGLPREAVIPSLVAPYAFGPIFGYQDHWPLLMNIWGSIGGYVSAAIVVAAAYGLLARRGPVGVLLLAWIVLALLKTFNVEPVATLWNLVPGISATAFFRYAQPAWELAFVILASWAVDRVACGGKRPRIALLAATIALLIIVAGGLWQGAGLWGILGARVGLRNSALGSAAWAAITALACLLLLARVSQRRPGFALAALLVVDSLVLFAIPTLSNPRAGSVDMRAVEFLRGNLGLNRFYSLGPIAPNYSAYFGIASINHNYLPVDRRWVRWVHDHLDSGLTEPVVFDGRRNAGNPTASQELRRNVHAYEEAGVKYVVVHGNEDPLANADATREAGARKVYGDVLMTIYELPGAKPYFESLSGRCVVDAHERTVASVTCEQSDILLRRELHFPGWSARVNNRDVSIAEYSGLFQAIALPPGRSQVHFTFAPPFAAWSWLVSLAAWAALALPALRDMIIRRRATAAGAAFSPR